MALPTGPHRRDVLTGLVAALAAPGLLASCQTPGEDQETTMTDPDPIERLEAAINSHDPQRIADCFTPDYRSETPHRPEDGFTGNDRVRANWVAILARIPDLRAQVLRRATAGPELWSEWEMTGTGPGGTPALLTGPVVLTTRDGLIDWTRFYLAPVPAAAGSPMGG